jgi:DNA-binding transcriptional LysR family regulator
MIDFEDMRYFVEVLDQGGFNRAAAVLGVSKSVVSRRIAAMEEDLGARLLSRTTHGVTPTEAGLEFKARAEAMLGSLSEAREAVAREGGEMVGRLRISAPLAFGMRHIAPLLAQMAERHPKLELEVSLSDRVVDLIGERFDVAVRIGELRDSRLVARRIAAVRTVVVASPAYLERRGRPTSPADLGAHDCLIYTGSVSLDWTLYSGKRQVVVRPTGRLRSDNGETLVAWAVAGLGIAYVPSYVLGDALENGSLLAILNDCLAPDFGVYVVRPPGRNVPAKLRTLIDNLVEHFSSATL